MGGMLVGGMGAMSGMQEMGEMADAMEQMASTMGQMAEGMTGGAQDAGAAGGADASGGQGGLQGLEQEISQTLQTLTSEIQQAFGGGQQPNAAGGGQSPNAAGGGQSPQGMPEPMTNAGPQAPASNSGQPAGIAGNEAAELPDLQNLEVDAGGGAGSSRPSHVGGDLDRLRNEVVQGEENGTISSQVANQTLDDIGSGNVQAVEQDLTGTSGSVAGLQNSPSGQI